MNKARGKKNKKQEKVEVMGNIDPETEGFF